jgi:WD40 repeat protein
MTGKLVRALTRQTGFTDQTWRIWGLAFSPDGRRLAATSQEGSVQVWDLATGQVVLNLIGHEGETVTVAYSSDGQRLATSGRDGTVRVWEAGTGQSLLVLEPGLGGLTGAAFDPTGTRLAVSGDNGVRLYALPLADLVALARKHVTRSLTTEECQTYLHTSACP